MKVLSVKGDSDNPYFSVAASALGTARFTPLRGTDAAGLVGRALRIHGRLDAPAGGGSVVVRCSLIPDGVQPADGSASGNVLAGKTTFNGAFADGVTAAATAAVSFSAVFALGGVATNGDGDFLPIPTKDISLRISNPGTAYSGGTLYIDTVEILG